MKWLVYIVKCGDGTFYTGITNDLSRRMAAHRAGRGAKYLRGRLPLEVVYVETGHDGITARIRESQIKKLSRKNKSQLAMAAAGSIEK